MVRTSLLAAALLCVVTPLAAQEEWTSRRPDGHGPLGLMGDRVLQPGELELSYRFHQIDSRGTWTGRDSLRLAQVQAAYLTAPLQLTAQSHQISVAYGLSERFSVLANLEYARRERQEIDRTATIARIESITALGDAELTGLYEFITEGLYVAHVQLGAIIPTGNADPGDSEQPYDMRPGAGSFGFTPGLTVQTQNERGSVGAQVKGRIYVAENSSDYKVGNRIEGSTWIALRINEFFSFSARLRYESWGRISGTGDPELVAAEMGSATPIDPGHFGFDKAGNGTDVLVGLNFYIPEDAHLGGSRLAIELLTPASRSYSGPQFGKVGGLVVGWQRTF